MFRELSGDTDPLSLPSKPLHWRRLQQMPAQQRPVQHLRTWLLDSESLTAKLLALSGHQFRVQVLRQLVTVPPLNERRALAMTGKRLALVREVILYGRNEPWVFARSVLPLSSLTGRLRHLRKQGTRPLGAFLFSQPQLQRGVIAITAISRDHAYLPLSLKLRNLGPLSLEPRDQLAQEQTASASLWGRRSVFSLAGKPLLVSEVFLDNLQCELARAKKLKES